MITPSSRPQRVAASLVSAATILLLAATLATCSRAQPLLAPPLPATAYGIEDAIGGLKFTQPLAIVSAPGETDRLFIVEKTGKIQDVSGLASDKPESRLFLDLTHPRDGALEAAGECGLLGLAFHPAYAQTGRFFVYYSLKIGGQLHQRVSEFHVAKAGPHQADAASEQPLFTQKDPANNHNGGDLAFGPDGYLYISVGDGGAGNDTLNQARFINKGFHAAILRIDVDKKPGNLPPNKHPDIALAANSGAFYTVPADNPFIGATSYHGEPVDPNTVRTEIWATGLRNPWRISFDPATQRLFTGDVGQNLHEEIDIITKGGDYGWSHREGNHPFLLGPGGAKDPPEFKPIDPIYDYPRTTGLSVTGGVVYHGKVFPELQKAYIFADYAFGRIIALREKNQPQWAAEILIPSEPGIAGIGVHPGTGEVLFANMASGKIRRLVRR